MAKASNASSIPTERLDQYERLVRTVEGLSRKGAKVPYTSINGNMSSYLSETGDLALRLFAPSFRRSYDYVAGLKPKQTTRRKKA